MSSFRSELQALMKKREVGFYSALIDMINIKCEEGEFAETIVGVMRRAEIRLLIAAEKASEADQIEKASKMKENQVLARPGMTKDTAPKGINKR